MGVRVAWAMIVGVGCSAPEATVRPDAGVRADTSVERRDTGPELQAPDPLFTDCHPLDPVGAPGTQWTYDVVMGETIRRREIRRTVGPDLVEGTSVATSVRQEGEREGTAGPMSMTRWRACGRDGAGLEVAQELRLDAITPVVTGEPWVWLPSLSSLEEQPEQAWTIEAPWRATVPLEGGLPDCPATIEVSFDQAGAFRSRGPEPVRVPAFDDLLAGWRVEGRFSARIEARLGVGCPLPAWLEDTIPTAESAAIELRRVERWYVRGLGLVKEIVLDDATGLEVERRELAGCRGLAACPAP